VSVILLIHKNVNIKEAYQSSVLSKKLWLS